MNQIPPWLVRSHKVIVAAQWVALTLGAISSASADITGTTFFMSLGLNGVYTAVASAHPSKYEGPGPRIQIVVFAGVALTMTSILMTGGLSSPFLLMGIMPGLLAALLGGVWLGLITSVISASVLVTYTISTTSVETALRGAGLVALYPLVALVVARIRHLLEETSAEATALAVQSMETQERLDRLTHAHDLLARLSDIYGDAGVSPVEVAKSALEAVVDAYPGSFASASMFDPSGPLAIARVGTDSPNLVMSNIPLQSGPRQIGSVSLSTRDAMSDAQRAEISELLRPVAVAFENSLILQGIAEAAVSEERHRLARELHDEMGPALASLGLSLDVAEMTAQQPEVSEMLVTTRSNVTRTVEHLRTLIADLRSEQADSVSAEIEAIANQLAPVPPISAVLDERRPPPSGLSRQISAIVTEAVRNAHRHGNANRIDVTGWIDSESFDVLIKDDGDGFDPTATPTGHWGLAGMRERSARIGARLAIESSPHGTTVHLTRKGDDHDQSLDR